MNRTIEIRTTGSAPAAGEGSTISGYAIVWNVESRVLASWDGSFIETIERGAVTDELIAASDVTALFNHERGQLLARSVNGEGTLKLAIDDTGLRFEFEAPNTTLGNDVLELVKRGDLRGCSFAFTANEEDIEYYRRGEQRYRIVRKLSGIYDVSVVVDPAYTQTSVDARSFDTPVLEEPKVSAEQLQRQADLRRIEIEKISINQPI